jgi:uncharacterized protein
MRRRVFESSDEAVLEQLMKEVPIGELGIVDAEGYPRIVPVNFAFLDGAVYFHGALAGEKHALLSQRPRATFMVYRAYSSIPSTVWSTDGSGCPASICYRSAHVRGRGSIVEDVGEKALALQRLMEKDQPEGGYRHFVEDAGWYEASLRGVGVFKVEAESISVKNKFVQHKSREDQLKLLAFLEARALPVDLETARIVRGQLAQR